MSLHWVQMAFLLSTRLCQPITSPAGGESWVGDTSETISWTTTPGVGDVALDLSTDGGTTWRPDDVRLEGVTLAGSWLTAAVRQAFRPEDPALVAAEIGPDPVRDSQGILRRDVGQHHAEGRAAVAGDPIGGSHATT